jgi:hypothetical protein
MNGDGVFLAVQANLVSRRGRAALCMASECAKPAQGGTPILTDMLLLSRPVSQQFQNIASILTKTTIGQPFQTSVYRPQNC